MDIKSFLTERKVAYRVLAHPASHTAADLARSVHMPPRIVAKTVLVHANHGFADVVAVLPSDGKIDLDKLQGVLGGAEVRVGTTQDVATRCPDCDRGVLPPFGSQYGMRTVVDRSLAEGSEIVFEGNTHDEALLVDWNDYYRIENPLTGDFAIIE